MTLLRVEHLSVGYVTDTDIVTAVKNVSFSVDKGVFFGIAGESGSGKSTLVKALIRILQPPGVITGGRILFDDEDLLRASAERLREIRWQNIAMVFQSALDSLNPVLTVRAQFNDMGLAKNGRRFTQSQLEQMLTDVHLLPDVLDGYPHQFSGGMRQRIGIALALALRPKLLILDEPTTALDVIVQRDILSMIKRLQDANGFSVLMITHDLPILLALSDELMVMRDGVICEYGTPKAIRTSPQHEYTRQLLSAMHLMDEQP